MAALLVIFLVVISSLMAESGQGVKFTLDCTPTYYNATWTMEAIQDRSIFITLQNAGCNKNVTENGTAINFVVMYDQCNTIINETSELLIINNNATMRVKEILGGVAVREYYYIYSISCELSRNKNLSASGTFNVSEEIVTICHL